MSHRISPGSLHDPELELTINLVGSPVVWTGHDTSPSARVLKQIKRWRGGGLRVPSLPTDDCEEAPTALDLYSHAQLLWVYSRPPPPPSLLRRSHSAALLPIPWLFCFLHLLFPGIPWALGEKWECFVLGHCLICPLLPTSHGTTFQFHCINFIHCKTFFSFSRWQQSLCGPRRSRILNGFYNQLKEK